MDTGVKDYPGVMESRANRAERTADHPGDLLVAHVLEEAKDQHLAMFRREPIECGVNQNGLVGVERRLLGTARQERLVRQGDIGVAFAQDSARAVMCDAEPGAERLRSGQPGPVTRRLQEAYHKVLAEFRDEPSIGPM